MKVAGQPSINEWSGSGLGDWDPIQKWAVRERDDVGVFDTGGSVNRSLPVMPPAQFPGFDVDVVGGPSSEALVSRSNLLVRAIVDDIPLTQFETRHWARQNWLKTAREQLTDVHAEAEEEGIDPPSEEACAFAGAFIQEFSKIDLPEASVFADDDRGVSIQMEVEGFIFLLTCLEGGSGIYNAVHDTYRVAGSYRDLSILGIAESEFFKHMRCLMQPLSKHAGRADQTE